MKSIHLTGAALLFVASSFSAVAQDRTIGGTPVPEGQLSAVEDRCSELQAQQGTTGSQTPETSMDKTTEARVAPTTGQGSPDATLDVAAITLQQCIDGGFTAAEAE